MSDITTKKKRIAALLLAGTLLCSPQALAQKGNLYVKSVNWAVQRVDPQDGTATPYCVMASTYSEGATLSLAENIDQEASIGLNFTTPVFDAQDPIDIVLDPGAGVQIARKATPTSDKAIVARLGADRRFLRALKRTGFLRVEIGKENYSFNLSNIDDAELRLNNCLFSIARNNQDAQVKAAMPDQEVLEQLDVLQDQIQSLTKVNEALAFENQKLNSSMEERVAQQKIAAMSKANDIIRKEMSSLEEANSLIRRETGSLELAKLNLLKHEKQLEQEKLEIQNEKLELQQMRTKMQVLEDSYLEEHQALTAMKDKAQESLVFASRAKLEAMEQLQESAVKAKQVVEAKTLAERAKTEAILQLQESSEKARQLAQTQEEIEKRKQALKEELALAQVKVDDLKRQKIERAENVAVQAVSAPKVSDVVEEIKDVASEAIEIVQVEPVEAKEPTERVASYNSDLTEAQAHEANLMNFLEDAEAPIAKSKTDESSKRANSLFRKSQHGERAKDVVEDVARGIDDDLASDVAAFIPQGEFPDDEDIAQAVDVVDEALEDFAYFDEPDAVPSPDLDRLERLSNEIDEKIAAIAERTADLVVEEPIVEAEELAVLEPVQSQALDGVTDTVLAQEQEAYELAHVSSAIDEVYEPVNSGVSQQSYSSPTSGFYNPPVVVAEIVGEIAPQEPVEVNMVDQVSGPDAVVHQWRLGDVYVSSEQRPVSNEMQFEGYVQEYLERTQQRCEGDYAIIPDKTMDRNDARLDTYEIACVSDAASSSASLLFLSKAGSFTVVAHEAAVDNMETAMALRDQFSSIAFQ